MSIERRRAPRIELLGRVHGHIVPPDGSESAADRTVTVREMSLGGLSFHADTPFPVGEIHEFHLTLGDDSAVVLRGRVVRCEEIVAEDGGRLFLTGVQFIDDPLPDGPGDVGGLIDKIR